MIQLVREKVLIIWNSNLKILYLVAMEPILEDQPNFYKLLNLSLVTKWKPEQRHLQGWYDYEIYATTLRDFQMQVWNGTHPVEENTVTHTCPAGSRVRVWMVSRFGDVGVTDNLVDPIGYRTRGVNADKDLIEYEFRLKTPHSNS
jgi:hypothetical protein